MSAKKKRFHPLSPLNPLNITKKTCPQIFIFCPLSQLTEKRYRYRTKNANFRFFNVFILKQAHLHPKVTKQANFRGSLQNSRAKIENCANFFARSCKKTVKDREPIFCSNVIWSKKVFHVYLNKKSNFYDIKLRKTLV